MYKTAFKGQPLKSVTLRRSLKLKVVVDLDRQVSKGDFRYQDVGGLVKGFTVVGSNMLVRDLRT